MKFSIRQWAAVAAVALSATAAQADVITFENVELGAAPLVPLLTNGDAVFDGAYYVAAYSNAPGAAPGDFSLVGNLLSPSDLSPCAGISCPTNNSTSFVLGLNDAYFALGRNDGAGFHVNSFDASFVGIPGVTYGAVSGLIRLIGVGFDDSSTVETYQLAGPNAMGSFNFSNFQTSASFASTEFSYVLAYGFACNTTGNCSAFSSNQAQFALDNINVSSVTAVPEPETWSMLVLGLAGIGAISRRRNRSNSPVAA